MGNGKVIKKERDLNSFVAVAVQDGLDLELTQGDENSMIIEADENIIDNIIAEVNEGILKIYCKPHIMKAKKRKIYLTFKELNGIKASGGSDVYAGSTITSDKFEVVLSGGSDLDKLILKTGNFKGDIGGGSDAVIAFESVQDVIFEVTGGSDVELSNVSGETFELRLGGGSDAIINGNVNRSIIRASGGSDIDAYGFTVNDCEVYLSGASEASISVNSTLDLTLGGASNFYCKGNPKIIHEDVCKSCDFEIR
jgi:hypothetical protein